MPASPTFFLHQVTFCDSLDELAHPGNLGHLLLARRICARKSTWWKRDGQGRNINMEKQEHRFAKVFLPTSPSYVISGRDHIILLLNSLCPTLKLVRGFYALFSSATLPEHSNKGFFCLLRLQPYAECQLAWSKNNSKTPARLSVQISDLYLKTHFVENAFWWCLLMHVFLQTKHTEGLREGWLHSSALCSCTGALQNSQLAAPTWDQSLLIPTWDQPLPTQTAAGSDSPSGTPAQTGPVGPSWTQPEGKCWFSPLMMEISSWFLYYISNLSCSLSLILILPLACWSGCDV